jgi:phosphatidylglycerophosphate synthase
VQSIGGALFLLHSILDGCDGELARLRFQESRRGGLLDFWGDNLVHVTVFGAMGIGLARTVGARWPLWCAASAVLFTAASAYLVYHRTMRRREVRPALHVGGARQADARVARRGRALAPRISSTSF